LPAATRGSSGGSRGEVEKLVIMRQGKIESVVLRGDDYERLVNGRSG
jgi:hypothetical protein